MEHERLFKHNRKKKLRIHIVLIPFLSQYTTHAHTLTYSYFMLKIHTCRCSSGPLHSTWIVPSPWLPTPFDANDNDLVVWGHIKVSGNLEGDYKGWHWKQHWEWACKYVTDSNDSEWADSVERCINKISHGDHHLRARFDMIECSLGAVSSDGQLSIQQSSNMRWASSMQLARPSTSPLAIALTLAQANFWLWATYLCSRAYSNRACSSHRFRYMCYVWSSW